MKTGRIMRIWYKSVRNRHNRVDRRDPERAARNRQSIRNQLN